VSARPRLRSSSTSALERAEVGIWPVSDARGRRLNVGSARASGQTRRATRRFGARPAPLGAPRKNPQHPPRRNAGRRAPSGVAPLRTLRHLAGGGGERPAAAGARGAARRPEVETTSKENGSDPDAEATVKRPPPHGPDAFRKRATASFTVSSVASEKWPAPATSGYVAFPRAADRRGPRPNTLSLSPLTTRTGELERAPHRSVRPHLDGVAKCDDGVCS